MTLLLRFDGAVAHDPAVDAWLASRPPELRGIAIAYADIAGKLASEAGGGPRRGKRTV